MIPPVNRGATTLLLLAVFILAAPSADSFTLLPAAQRLVRSEASSSSSSRIHAHFSSDLDIQNEDTATAASTTSPSYKYDSAEAFTEDKDPPYTDLMDLLKARSKQEPVDIIRDLDGHPLSPEYFARAMDTANVQSYKCPETDAFRGFMSNGCRVHLEPGGQTAFYKHVVFRDLNHAQTKLKKAPAKLLRDTKSYMVVASFLSSKACRALVDQTGVCIPKCYDAQLLPDYDNPMESKFSFLLEDFSPSDGWHQRWLLHDIEECKAALSTYAKMHAFFWHGSDFWKNDLEAGRELEAGVWPSGSYVQPKFQGQDQLTIVAKEWDTKKLKFKAELSSFGYWDNLGTRLESVAQECGRLAHPFAEDDVLSQEYQKYRTFTHGDPKQANLFFRSTTTTDSSNCPQETPLPQVGLIDFQWSGFGLAASDIAHFLTSSVHADRLVNDGHDSLLRYYFDELQTYLVEYGAFDTAEDAVQHYSYETLMDQYETAVLDICRIMIAYTWSRFTEPVEKDDPEGCARTMNKTSYNKSIPNIVWLLDLCDKILKSRGV